MPQSLTALEQTLGHRFDEPNLLREALTHASVSRAKGERDNERLEFLGDRVLGLLVSERLIKRFPDDKEGPLANRLNALVRKEACAEVGKTLGLDSYLRVGRSEAREEGPVKPALIADACEAVLGALYLDGGLDAVLPLFEKFWLPLFERVIEEPKDAKTALQEFVQARGAPVPTYAVVERSGPDHAPVFVIEARIDGFTPARGQGKSKRAAEQAAAQAMLATIGEPQ